MRRTLFELPALLMVCLVSAAPAQIPPIPPPLNSPEVHADKSVTFHFRGPNYKEVAVYVEGAAKALPMQKDDQGVWSVTNAPLAPDYYGYGIIADGTWLVDPSNHDLFPKNSFVQGNILHVPGPAALPWEFGAVPHGEIHHHFYKSGVVGDDRDFYVYTPPSYDPRGKQTYPVLYLLHGFSYEASSWIAAGFANVILDNLIAQGKATPMLVVMPLCYGAPEILVPGGPDLRDRNFRKFRETLLTEVIPRVEGSYLVSKDRDSRAVAGLSMGGIEALQAGLNTLDKFGWIGAFSSGGALSNDFDKEYPAVDSKTTAHLHLLWIACGTDDGLIAPNRMLRSWLASKNVKHVDIETPGAHTWMVWRRNLAEFASLLFR